MLLKRLFEKKKGKKRISITIEPKDVAINIDYFARQQGIILLDSEIKIIEDRAKTLSEEELKQRIQLIKDIEHKLGKNTPAAQIHTLRKIILNSKTIKEAKEKLSKILRKR